MPEYDNNMTGVLFVNDKQGNEKRPDMTGHFEIDGTKYRLAAWSRTSKQGGKRFLSLKVSPDEAPAQAEATMADTDPIPF